MVVRWRNIWLPRRTFVFLVVAILLPQGSAQEGSPTEPERRQAATEGSTETPSGESENIGSSESTSKRKHGEREEAEPVHGECYYNAEPFEGLVFFFTALTIGTFIMFLTMFPTFHGVQQTVVIYALGMVYALLGEYYMLYESTGMFGRSYCMWMNIDPHLLLFSMLPALITGDAMSIDTTVARRVYRQCIHLAGPGVLFSSFATALFLWWYLPYDWSFLLCLTVGSILAATDPVAVVNLLKDLGASPTLTVQIQGESLLNDGTAMVLYSVTSKMLEGEEFGTNKVIIFLFRVVVAAIVVGLILGWCCTTWIRLSCRRLDDHSSFVQISITLLCAYWSYILADGLFGMSGVLTTVSSALVLADRMWPSIVSKESMDNAWHMFEFMGNTAIFFLAGSWTGSIMYKIAAKDFLHLLVIYLICNIVRGAMLLLSLPVMRLLGEDIKPVSLADCAVMCWGGLRGAVGLSLAIHLSIDRAGGTLSTDDGRRVLFFTSGIAALTLLVNATTCPLLVKWLGIARTSKTRITIMKRVHYQLVNLANARTRNKADRHASDEVAQLNDLTGRIMDGMLQDVDHHISGDKADHSCWRFLFMRNEDSSEQEDISGARPRIPLPPVTHLGIKNSDNSVMSMDDGDMLLLHHDTARQAHKKVETEILELLRFPQVASESDADRDELVELLTQARPHKSMHQLVREAFICLLKAQYWEMNNKGEFLDDQEVRSALLQSLGTISESNNHLLADLRFIVNKMMTDGEMQLEDVGYEFEKDILHLEKPEETADVSDIMGCCARIEGSTMFSTAMVLVILANTVTIGIELADEGGGQGYMPVVNAGFGIAYLVEFAVRFGALKWGYFCDAWNVFDFTLLIIGLAGIVLEFMMMTANTPASAEENVNQSQSARIARFVKIFRVLRNVRIGFRVILAAKQHGLARRMDFTKGVSGLMSTFSNLRSSDQTVAKVRFVQILRSFVKAHLHCQKQFIQYFGKEGRLTSTEAARCLLDSRTEVFAATVMACNVAGNVDRAALEALYVLSDSNRVAEELLHFVEGAHTSGILGAREAETLSAPLKAHMSDLASLLHRAVRGEFGGFKDTMSNMAWFQRILSINPTAANLGRGQSTLNRGSSKASVNGENLLSSPHAQDKFGDKKVDPTSPRVTVEERDEWSIPVNTKQQQSLDSYANSQKVPSSKNKVRLDRGASGLATADDSEEEDVGSQVYSWSQDERVEEVDRSYTDTDQPRPCPHPPSPPTSLPPSSLPGSPLASPRCPTPPSQDLDGIEPLGFAYFEKGK